MKKPTKNNNYFEANFQRLSQVRPILKKVWDLFKDGFNESLYYKIVITKRAKKRTVKQNNLYWGYIIESIIQNDDNFTAEQWHKLFRANFLKREGVNTGGLVALVLHEAYQWNYTIELSLIIDEIAYSTTEITTVQETRFIEDIIKFASENLGINIDLSEENIENWKNEVNRFRK